MPLLMLKDLPRYECLLDAAKKHPSLDPSACEAYLHLLRAGDESFRVVDEHFQEVGLSQGRFTVLMLLTEKGGGCPQPRTPAELAEMSNVTRATMTGLIDTLERDGLVVRQADPQDRRQLTVHLTPKAAKFMSRILPEHFRRIAELMTVLSEKERKTLVRLLNKVVQQTAAALRARQRSAAR